jgi:uncharacterized protein involved in response to NO
MATAPVVAVDGPGPAAGAAERFERGPNVGATGAAGSVTGASMLGYLPPLVFVLAWVFALVGFSAPGADSGAPFEEDALRWMLFFGLGWNVLGGFVMHTIFARQTAEDIGWETNGFQYEVGFASLGIGLAGIYAALVDQPEAWVAASIAGSAFLLLAGVNHVREIIKDRNYAPGNTAILLSDFGVPISLLVLLLANNAI